MSEKNYNPNCPDPEGCKYKEEYCDGWRDPVCLKNIYEILEKIDLKNTGNPKQAQKAIYKKVMEE